MNGSSWFYQASIWVIPVVIAITFHEAAHGFVAHRFGDDTAWRLGRVTFNPFRHVDPVGTIVLPAILILMRAPFLFGYAKPVPVDFSRLNNPRQDMVLVALAGPLTNVALMFVSALLGYTLQYLPHASALWVRDNLSNSLQINAVLCVFNMIPLPPLDGGRVAVGLLPRPLALPLARIEPFGMVLLLLLIFIVPYIAAQLGRDVNPIDYVIGEPTRALIRFVLNVTGLR